jgi:hypothetical protein
VSPREDEHLHRDIARAVGLGALGACGRILCAVLLLVASFTWLAADSCGTERDDAADAAIEAAGRRQVAAALAQHRQTLKAIAAVAEADRARAASTRAVANAVAARELAAIVDDSTVAVRSRLDELPSTVFVPPQITARFSADAKAIAALQLTVLKDSLAMAELRSVITADSAVIQAKNAEIAARDDKIERLERKANPQCGRWCNRILGATAVIGTAIIANTVRNAFTGRNAMIAMSWEAP